MEELLSLLDDYRTGRTDAATVEARFLAAGWDQADVGLLLTNTAYTRRDMVDQFLADQARARRKQKNPLMQ